MRVAREYYRNKDLGRALLAQAQALKSTEYHPGEEKNYSVLTKLAQAGAALSGFGDGDTLTSLKSGDMIPDELFGWNTKTVLLAAVVLLILKARMKG